MSLYFKVFGQIEKKKKRSKTVKIYNMDELMDDGLRRKLSRKHGKSGIFGFEKREVVYNTFLYFIYI